MRIDLTELIERQEGAFLLFPMQTRVTYVWYAAGRAHERQRMQGYMVPVADSIIREQLKHVHAGCEATRDNGGLPEEDADQLDSVFRLAGVPFAVDRDPAKLVHSTENAVWVRFPGEDEIPIRFSRYAKWGEFWGKSALFVWWQCESEAEYQQRMDDAARAEARARLPLRALPPPVVEAEHEAEDNAGHNRANGA